MAILEETLMEAGASVITTRNGREAVERVRSDGARAYDLVLMDVQMPEMDGYEATRLIRQLAPALPVIGQTAHALPEEKAKCLDAGMLDHIPKPTDAVTLVKMVRRHVLAKRAG
jgi:CheY-like chemotaxis protein